MSLRPQSFTSSWATGSSSSTTTRLSGPARASCWSPRGSTSSARRSDGASALHGVLPAAPRGGPARRPAARHRRVRRLPADHGLRRAPDRDHDLQPRRLRLRAARHARPAHAGSCPRPSSRASACRSCSARDRPAARARARRDRGHRRRARRPGDRALVRPRRATAASTAALGLFIGWSFIGAGLFAWWRRPDNRFGVLMTAVGFAFFLGVLTAADSSLAVHDRRALLQPLRRGLRAHAARVSRRPDRLAAAAQGARGGYVAVDRRPAPGAAVRRPEPSSAATTARRRRSSATDRDRLRRPRRGYVRRSRSCSSATSSTC